MKEKSSNHVVTKLIDKKSFEGKTVNNNSLASKKKEMSLFVNDSTKKKRIEIIHNTSTKQPFRINPDLKSSTFD